MDRFSRVLKLAYGPLHAALVVGNVTLEWDDKSLVVPRFGVSEPDLQMDIGRQADLLRTKRGSNERSYH